MPLQLDQWLLCAAMASAVLWYSELRKLMSRRMAEAQQRRRHQWS
ncbi:MAG: cation-translocating P-type ATPase C-terminal domain-containing protein [Pseudomonadota bacterium]|nr:cation-translocating P-type ATPase C-terminal domain-containing protein [Pseudomonadota bacterium]